MQIFGLKINQSASADLTCAIKKWIAPPPEEKLREIMRPPAHQNSWFQPYSPTYRLIARASVARLPVHRVPSPPIVVQSRPSQGVVSSPGCFGLLEWLRVDQSHCQPWPFHWIKTRKTWNFGQILHNFLLRIICKGELILILNGNSSYFGHHFVDQTQAITAGQALNRRRLAAAEVLLATSNFPWLHLLASSPPPSSTLANLCGAVLGQIHLWTNSFWTDDGAKAKMANSVGKFDAKMGKSWKFLEADKFQLCNWPIFRPIQIQFRWDFLSCFLMQKNKLHVLLSIVSINWTRK